MKTLLVCIVFCLNVAHAQILNTSDANKIADAIYHIEGGSHTKYPYGIVSIKTNNPRQACINTIEHTYIRWQASGKTNNFYEFLARRYAPVGVSNDPHGLNRNWLKNLTNSLPQGFPTKKIWCNTISNEIR